METEVMVLCGQRLPETEDDRVSGMIVGEGMALTPGDVQQMRRVPELVFINCCHLVRPDGDPAKQKSDRQPAHRLAANLAVEFIKIGVRAVIAAGWAVKDEAAQTFAETFYRQMTKGRRFGEAVRLAREQTWKAHRCSNTWGAYQCYGDPDFRLRRDNQIADAGEHTRYVSPAEALVDLGNRRADAECAHPERMARLQQDLRNIERALDEIAEQEGLHWCGRGDVAEALGLAQGELGRLDDNCPSFAAWCGELKRRAPEYQRSDPSAPAGAIAVEVGLLVHLKQGDLTENAKALFDNLRHGLRRGASQRQVASILDCVELLQVLAGEATHKRKHFRSQAESLKRLVDLLKEWRRGQV
jgi:hypothetical protein